MMCYKSLENSQQGLQLCFKPHFNQRFAQKVMALQNVESPNFGNFRTKWHLDVTPVANHK
jgi:hypothetical protein